MAKEIKLNAQLRTEENGKAKSVLKYGMVPAVVYGSGTDNRSIKIKSLDFEKVFAEAGESNLIDLTIGDGQPVKVIIKDLQRSPLKNQIIHVDFYQVDMSKKIETMIPLYFSGESKAVKELGGVLVKSIDEVAVKCLPGDLVDHIEVDLSALATFDDVIRIKDLKVPASVEILNDSEDAVASIIEQKVEEVESKEETETVLTEEGNSEETLEGTKEESKAGANPTAEKKK